MVKIKRHRFIMRDDYPKNLYMSPTYNSWFNMKRRCRNMMCRETKNYGQRGIRYDPKWSKFSEFFKDMGHRPIGKTLDRIDVNGDYCKRNCRWATPSEQNLTRRPQSNTGIKGITKHNKGGHFLVRIAPFKLSYARDFFEAKYKLEQMQRWRKLIKFKEGTMIPESVKIVRRLPKEEYGFEEVTLTALVEEEDTIEQVIVSLKNEINVALGIKDNKEKKNAKSKQNNAGDSDETPEDTYVEDAQSDVESSEDDEDSDSKVHNDSADQSNESEDYSSEDDEPEQKPKKSSKRKAGKTKQEGGEDSETEEQEDKKTKKSFKRKPQHYDRGIEQHKEIFSRVLRTISPDWNKTPDSKKKAKQVSEKMEGEPFLDADGEVEESFKTKMRKLLK